MTTIAVGTEKGAYLLRSDDRRDWRVEGPHFAGWKATAFGDAPDGTAVATVASNWFGHGVFRSTDLADWQQTDDAPAWPEDGDREMNQVWTLHRDGDRLYAGVDEAGLFTSDDGGVTWQPVDALNEHASRSSWMPGLGGLCAHRVLTAGERIWVAISSVGVFRSDDGGDSFQRKDEGVEAAQSPEDGAQAAAYCVHGVVQDPDDPDRIWRQEHLGMFRTTDGGDTWERNEEGLPSRFGFAIDRTHRSGRLFCAPLHSDANRVPVDGAFRVYASDDDGDSWHVAGTGWPEDPTFTGVLRGAITTDQAGGVWVGTTSGDVWGTTDDGETWERLPGTFPRILAVHSYPDR
jgi:photosystem II stability/assembly factor-like uncharacterized protein